MADRNALVREHEDLYKKMKAFNLAEGGATQSKVQADLHRLDGQIKARDEQITELKDAVKVTRLPPDFTDRVQFTLFCLQGFNTNSRWLGTWPRGQLREMFQLLFGGPTRKSHPNSKKVPVQVGIFVRRVEDKRSGKAALSWTAKGWFPQVNDQVWMDPKVRSLFQTPMGKRPIDRARLVKLISNLDVEQFRFARMAFNTSKLEGIRGRW